MTNPSQIEVSSKYGAPMGRVGKHGLEGKVTLSNVVIDSGGYDEGGAYWGRGAQLWVAWDDEGGCVYFRAARLRNAIIELMDEYDVNQFDIQFEEQTWNLYWHIFECPTDGANCGRAPSEDADSCTCDCGEYIEADRICDTEVEVQRPITRC